MAIKHILLSIVVIFALLVVPVVADEPSNQSINSLRPRSSTYISVDHNNTFTVEAFANAFAPEPITEGISNIGKGIKYVCKFISDHDNSNQPIVIYDWDESIDYKIMFIGVCACLLVMFL